MDKDTFTYRYSAPENKEVREIRKKYLPTKESRLEELKRLDRGVQRAGVIEALCVGGIGCLLFGIGLCLVMHVIGDSILLGIILSLLGCAAMLAAYPLRRFISGRAKARLVPQILRLTDELRGEKAE